MNITLLTAPRHRGSAAAFVLLTALALPNPARSENKFLQHNLVSDLPGLADFLDPKLVNPWAISFTATSPFWITNNHSGTAAVYDSAGKPAPLTVAIRRPGGSDASTPTGQVFNGTAGFVVGGVKPAQFIFATEDGTILGWYGGIANNEAVVMVNRSGSAVYKGLALATPDAGPLLYAANFRGGTIEVFGADCSPKNVPGAFSDPTLPAGFAPFNVYVSGSKVYVAYARQDEDKQDDVPGNGNGFIDVFDLDGRLLQRLISGGMLNSPWGMAVAPEGFADFGKSLLVGNFGDGTINAYDPVTGAFLGTLQDASGKPVVNNGLWALQFGNGKSGGDANTLYFTAGISGPAAEAIESHGLFGSIQPAPSIQTAGVVDGAAFQPAISPNGWVTVFGKNLAPTTRSWADSDFIGGQLPTKLDGVSVTIDDKPAYVAYISPMQLNVLAPVSGNAGSVKVQSRDGDLVSAPWTAEARSTTPAFFKADKYAVSAHADASPITVTAPAQAGEIITFYGAGFGATNPPAPEGQLVTAPRPLANPVIILIDGIQSEVAFAGLVAPGLYQFNVRVPPGVRSGDAAVVVEAAGVRSPDGVFLPTKASDPTPPPPPPPPYSAQIDNFMFMPPIVTLTAGAELTWTNKQGVEHTVVSNDGKFASAALGQNETFSVKLTAPGTYPYHCSIHPFMKGSVVVQ